MVKKMEITQHSKYTCVFCGKVGLEGFSVTVVTKISGCQVHVISRQGDKTARKLFPTKVARGNLQAPTS